LLNRQAGMSEAARTRVGASAAKGPLEGLRVIDCATLFAGPIIATLMGDFGADIIKIEHPSGDPLRNMGAKKHGHGLWWKTAARNKRCIALDLKAAGDAEIFKALVADADILVENFRTGTLESWGLGWQVLSEINPRLVMVRVTGFGQTGPYKRRAGFGTLAEAMSGFAHITGQPDGPPTLPPFGLADGVAACYGCFASMFAIYERDVRGSGKGQYIDLAIYEPIFALLGAQPIIFDQLGIIQNRTGNRSVNNAPRNTYRTRDGRWVALSAAAPSIVRRVLDLTGGPGTADDPRFLTNLDRIKHVEEIDAIVGGWIVEHDLAEVLETFGQVEAAIAPIYDIEQVFHDPQYVARETVTSVPDEDLGSVRMQNVFPVMSRTPGMIRFAGARMDQHRNEILDGLCAAGSRGSKGGEGTVRVWRPSSESPRDFIGYGRQRPDPRWPGKARIAVNFAINYEEGSEYSVPDGSGRTELGLAEAPGGRVPAGQRDLAFETMYEYGSRVGIWRLFDLFLERKLPATVFGCAVALERNPEVAEAIASSNFDVCCHGWRWEEHFRLSEEEEREHIALAIASLTRSIGERPLGWYCRFGPSENTRPLLVEEGGFLYDSDAYNDELPYWVEIEGRNHLVVPYTMDANDGKFAAPSGFSSPDDFESYLKATFDQLYKEGAERPGLMSVGLHPRITGRPARARALANVLDHILKHDRVWVCSRLDIARHWHAQHAPSEAD
jgi:crotonobetainyl-CoA:carnitine CoA-transferase CaiB-like acyl-CoA transferase/peptidoglycan/xylan/chitin deacetylase (PgdA/CDA1 family)